VKIDPSIFLKELPADTRHALIELAERIELFISANTALQDKEYATLCKLIEVFVNKSGLMVDLPNKDANYGWHSHLQNLLHVVSSYSVDVHAEDSERELADIIDSYRSDSVSALPFGYAALSADEKVLIHDRLQQVRATIESSKLKESKKNALYSRLAKLSEEVDRSGTKTDAFFSFGLDLAMTAGEMAEKAKPAINEFKDVLEIIFRRRSQSEGVRLPKPDDFPSLPAPESE